MFTPRRGALAAVAIFVALAGAAQAHDRSPLDRDTKFYVEPDTISQAVWFTSGTPAEVRQAVKRTVDDAARRHTVPVLVAYYVPGRDCSQYSAGGAPSEQPTRTGSTPSRARSASARRW